MPPPSPPGPDDRPGPPRDAADPRLLVAVPNVSEGRDDAVIDAIGAAYAAGGARVLDVHRDPDHHRSVHTLVGAAGALAEALAAGAAEALARIDLGAERGAHPHVGALDVAPVVFLDEARRASAEAEAHRLAGLLGDLGLPVLLYGALAGGRTRAALRRGGRAGLAGRLASGEVVVDAGPVALHPTAGAVLVGARPPLLAFNLELAAPAGLDDARAIAARVREGGPDGLPGVRAIGLALAHRDGVAQVSCNVEDHRAVPLARLVAAVSALAGEAGARVSEAEVVGLPPQEAFAGFPEDLPVRHRRTLQEALRDG